MSHDNSGSLTHRSFVKGPAPHSLPVGVYWLVFFVLVGFTVMTVVLAEYDFGSMAMFVTLLIAGAKASLVAAIFMHLWFDNKFYTLVFCSCLLFLSLFVLFPIMDFASRADLDEVKRNYLPRDEKVHEYKIEHPDALPLRPGLAEPDKDKLVFEAPGEHHSSSAE